MSIHFSPRSFAPNLKNVFFALLLLHEYYLCLKQLFQTQMILLTVLLVAMMNYFVGACLPPTEQQKGNGFIGWSGKQKIIRKITLQFFFN